MTEEPEQPEGPTEAELSYPLVPHSPHVLGEGRRSRFYLIDVTGLEADQIDPLIPIAREIVAEHAAIPVFLTTLMDYSVFRRAKVIFEALPPRADSAYLAPDLDWDTRHAELRAMVEEKWQPVGKTSFGRSEA